MKDEQILLIFGKNLRRLRIERNLSQEELADLCELDRTYVSGVERGKRNLSLLNIVKLAKSLDISAEKLLAFKTEI